MRIRRVRFAAGRGFRAVGGAVRLVCRGGFPASPPLWMPDGGALEEATRTPSGGTGIGLADKRFRHQKNRSFTAP